MFGNDDFYTYGDRGETRRLAESEPACLCMFHYGETAEVVCTHPRLTEHGRAETTRINRETLEATP